MEVDRIVSAFCSGCDRCVGGTDKLHRTAAHLLFPAPGNGSISFVSGVVVSEF